VGRIKDEVFVFLVRKKFTEERKEEERMKA